MTSSPRGGGAEPLIVEGIYDSEEASFTPKAGQPSFRQALEAYQSGVPVFFAFDDADADSQRTDQVIMFVIEGGGDKFTLSIGNISWSVNSY